MGKSPQAGLLLLNAADLGAALDGYSYFHAARASLLAQTGEPDGAIAAYGRAIELTTAGPERRLLQHKRDLLRRD